MTKKLLVTIGLLLAAFHMQAGWTSHSFSFDGKSRQYMLYVPEAYVPATPATLIIALHGLGGSMGDIAYTGIPAIADTANIIIAAPQALDFESPLGIIEAAWNNGIAVDLPGFGTVAVNGDVDDAGFISAIMDTVQLYYNIKEHRRYVCGMSMGGFMTQRLACELSNKFDAAASVSGTYALALPGCDPAVAIPVAHFHGTADSVVTYDGFTPFPFLGYVAVGLGVDALIDRWKTINECLPEPETINLPDANGDGLSLDHFIYTNGSGRSMTELFRVNGGTHTWYLSATTGNEFDYAVEIWKFFNRQYAITALEDGLSGVIHPELYPNPSSSDQLHINTTNPVAFVSISDIGGRVIIKQENPDGVVNIGSLRPGTYFVTLRTKNGETGTSKLIKL